MKWLAALAAGTNGLTGAGHIRSAMTIVRQLMLLDRRGVTAIEYGLICVFVFLVIVVSVRAMGTNLCIIFSSVSGSY